MGVFLIGVGPMFTCCSAFKGKLGVVVAMWTFLSLCWSTHSGLRCCFHCCCLLALPFPSNACHRLLNVFYDKSMLNMIPMVWMWMSTTSALGFTHKEFKQTNKKHKNFH